jgi:hypothetical protein
MAEKRIIAVIGATGAKGGGRQWLALHRHRIPLG